MVKIRKNISLLLAMVFPLLIMIMILEKPNQVIKIEDLRGEWEGFHNGKKAHLKINKDNNCSLSINYLSSSKADEYSGKCRINSKKKPFSFTMSNIISKDTSLYAIFYLEKTNILHMSYFSSKWRLRELSINNNKLTFVRTLLNEEK